MPPRRVLLADECVHTGTVRILRDAGWSVRSVREEFRGDTDEDILTLAIRLDATLITNDRDYGEVFRHGRRPPGCLLYVRVREMAYDIVAERLLAVLDDSRATGQMVVIEPDGNRYRALPPTGENDG